MPKIPIKKGLRSTVNTFIRRAEGPKHWKMEEKIKFGRTMEEVIEPITIEMEDSDAAEEREVEEDDSGQYT